MQNLADTRHTLLDEKKNQFKKWEETESDHTVAVVSAARGCTPLRPTTL